MNRKLLLYILPIVTLIVGFTIGVMMDFNNTDKPPNKPTQTQDNRLYTSQMATVRGQIQGVNGRLLSVRNTNGSIGDLRASNRIMIVKFSTSPNSRDASPSSDLQNIETDKDVVMTLEMVNGTYEVTQVQYIASRPAIPSIPPGEL